MSKNVLRALPYSILIIALVLDMLAHNYLKKYVIYQRFSLVIFSILLISIIIMEIYLWINRKR